MSQTRALVRRELAGWFATPIAYVFLIAFLLLAGFMTFEFGHFFERGQADLEALFQWLPVLLLLLVPAATMRTWAEERRLGTVELLLTLPCPRARVVFGKFLAAWLFAAIAVVLTTPLWAVVSWLGTPDHGTILAGYLGCLLLAAPLVALGCTLSALTRNQVVAFVLTLAGCLLLLVLGWRPAFGLLEPRLPAPVLDLLSRAGLLPRFEAITRGLLDLRDVAGFLVFLGLFLYWNLLAVEVRGAARSLDIGRRLLLAFLALVLAAEALFLADAHLPRWRLDLTAARLHSLSPGTRRILASLDEPVTMTFWFSAREAGRERARELDHARRVRDLLHEYAGLSGGRLRLREVDPEPFSIEEERALRLGLESHPLRRLGEPFFFGLVLSNSVDQREVVRWLDPARAAVLEYEITRRILALARPERPRLGILSSLPLAGGPVAGGRARAPRWLFLDVLAERFQVTIVPPDATFLPEDLDVLLVVHPKEIPDALRFALDRWVRAGRPALVCVDPYCESEVPWEAPDPAARRAASRTSDLPRLLRAWGVHLEPAKIVADRGTAMPAQIQGPRGPETLHYPLWQQLTADQVSREDFATAGLDLLLLGSPGALRFEEGTVEPPAVLLHSSADSRLVPEPQIRFFPDPRKLVAEFEPDDEEYVYGVRIRSQVRTAFPEGPPEAVPEAAAKPLPERPARLVVLSDVDFLHDRFWARLQQQGQGRQLVGSTSRNMTFLVNLLEDLAGGEELVSIRSRHDALRPFTRIVAMEKVATERYQDQVRGLQRRLQEIEAKLAEFELGGAGTEVLPGPRERQAVAEAQTERARLRRELRDLQYELLRDVQRLQTRVRIIVLGSVPCLLALAGAGAALLRAWRRRRGRRREGGGA